MKKLQFITVFILCSVIALNAYSQEKSIVYWSEDFEAGWGSWYADNGVWDVGMPTSGPNAAHSGTKCAGTNLYGNYPPYADTRLIRNGYITLPSASENPRLQFWHWFNISDHDWGQVQIKPSGSSNWIGVSMAYSINSNNAWTKTSIDLSTYAGQVIQIAFYFHAEDYWGGGDASTGWYVDDISLVTGPIIFNNPEYWEGGFGEWYADNGTWEVGVPTSGPNAAHSGQKCAATNLSGNYPPDVDTRLISPAFTLPVASENPRLRFWHWFDISDHDWGQVQIKLLGSPNWINLSMQYNGTSNNAWTYPLIDLSAYSGQSIQIAFHFFATDYWGGGDASSGWYIDDILIETNSILSVYAGDDFTLAYGGSATLYPTIEGGTEPYVFKWTPSTGLNNTNIENPVASPVSTTTYQLKVTDAHGCFRTDDLIITVPHTLNLKAFLEGPYNGTLMNANLNSSGYIPLSQPYNQLPWNYTGSESVASIPNADIVDWVLVELRETPGDASTANYYKAIERRAAFIKKNGSIVDLNGNSVLNFTVPINQNLYVVVFHRNHLGIMSSTAVTQVNGNYTYDYSTSSSKIYGGTLNCKQVSTGVWGMISGDDNGSGDINNFDKDDIWLSQNGLTGYRKGDYNMNGTVDATDKNSYWKPNAGKGTQISLPEPTLINVTFRVDMTNETVSGNVYLAGSFNGWNMTATPMTNTGNNIYQVTLPLNIYGYYTYKFINGTNWETLSAPCGTGSYGDRFVTLPSQDYVLPLVCFFSCNPCSITTVESENFDVSWGDWTTISVTGAQVWDRNNTWGIGNSPCASVSGYSGGYIQNEDWLISPALNLNNYTNEILSFQNSKNYTGPDLELKITTNYTGNPGTTAWTNLTYTKSPGAWTWTSSGDINISGFNGTAVRIAFKYTSTTTTGATWEIDNIEIKGE